jgi:hypothetical protein
MSGRQRQQRTCSECRMDQRVPQKIHQNQDTRCIRDALQCCRVTMSYVLYLVRWWCIHGHIEAHFGGAVEVLHGHGIIATARCNGLGVRQAPNQRRLGAAIDRERRRGMSAGVGTLHAPPFTDNTRACMDRAYMQLSSQHGMCWIQLVWPQLRLPLHRAPAQASTRSPYLRGSGTPPCGSTILPALEYL